MIAISESEHCEACSIEARIGTEEVPHPIDPRLHTCCVAQPQPRSVVRWFAAAMERELHENDHKGTWDRCTLGYLAKRLREEVEELVVAATDGHVNANIGDEGYRVTQWTETDVSRVLSEAADVGNFAMMIADVCAKRAMPSVAAQLDGWSTTTIKVENPTHEPVVVATMAGVSKGRFSQTESTELRAAFEEMAEVDRLRRCETTLLAYGRALSACYAASDQDGDAKYEADVAMEKAFEEIIEVSKRLAEKERLP